jgi:ferric-dicitrate binding protein FerR (iron transport regulator)
MPNNLKSYTQGQRSGHSINRLERDALQDAFWADAWEGYEKFYNKKQAKNIAKMRAEITSKTRNQKLKWQWLAIIAALALIVGFGGLLWLQSDIMKKQQQTATQTLKTND